MTKFRSILITLPFIALVAHAQTTPSLPTPATQLPACGPAVGNTKLQSAYRPAYHTWSARRIGPSALVINWLQSLRRAS